EACLHVRPIRIQRPHRLRHVLAAQARENLSDLVGALEADWAGGKARLDAGIDVLVLGSGVPPATNPLAARFPQSRCLFRDAHEVGAADPQDLIVTWEALADHGDPGGLLASLRSSLRPDGYLLCVEMAASSNLSDNLNRACAPFY